MLRKIKLMVTIVLLLLTTQAVFAESSGEVRLKYSHRSPAQNVRIWRNSNYIGEIYTGRFNLKVDTDWCGTWGEGTEVVDLANDNDLVGTFCADIVQSVPTYYTVYDVNMPEDAPIGGQNQTLFPNGMSDLQATHLRRLFENEVSSTGQSSTNAAAFQLAVWEIIYETSDTYDVSYYHYENNLRGSFYAKNGTVVALANQWLDTVVSQTGDPDIRLRVLTDPCKQDFSVILPDTGTPGVIPEPLTAVAVFGAITALGGYIRRRIPPRVHGTR